MYIHLDVKPINMIIGKDGRVWLTGFDLLGIIEQEGMPVGTPGLMSPEQAQGDLKTVGPWTDVFGLGATLYYLVTGRPPFLAGTEADTIQQSLEKDPVTPEQLNSSVPRDLSTICLKCLEKDPERRYPTARELAEDLGRFLEKRSVMVRLLAFGNKIANWSNPTPRK